MALEALLGSIFGGLVSLTADYIKGQLEVVWGGGLDDKLEQLKQLLLQIRSKVADAEEKQIVDAAVRTWLDALKKVAYEAEDVLDEFNYEILLREAASVETSGKKKLPYAGRVSDSSSQYPIHIRLKLGPKLNNILEKIGKIEAESAKFDFSKVDVANSYTNTAVSNETWSFVVEEDVVGRQEDKERIVSILIDSQPSKKIKQNDMLEEDNSGKRLAVLPIVGMGGIGKTTVAQLVYKDPRIVNHFELQGWVCVSDTWDLRKIIPDLVASLTGDDCLQMKLSPTLELMQRRLREALAGKRYLIVLDDVWNEDPTEWDRLKGLLSHVGRDGSEVVLTTRSERVSQIMGTFESYRLSYLEEREAWILFSSRAFAPGAAEKPEELVRIGMEIVKKCKGLPLALKMIGSLLYMKSDRSQWLEIKESGTWNLKTNILPALWLTYKHLPPQSKQCFAFCAVFPKDYKMEKERLIEMWMANGFIPCDGRLEVSGREIFDQLVQRSFLHDLEKKIDILDSLPITICRMHDLVHDLAKWIAGNACMTTPLQGSHEVAAPKDVYHLVSLEKPALDVNKTVETFPSLRTFIIDGYSAIAEISMYTFLRVFQLHGSVTGLPLSVKFLQHLRYLDLSSTNIKELPESTSTLLNLQTLILCGCHELCRLPESMPCMISLRHLYLDMCYELRKMPQGMGQMTNLQILTMYVVDAAATGNGIGELRGLQLSLKLELHNLRYVKDALEAKEANLHSKQDLQHLELIWREWKYLRLPLRAVVAGIEKNEDNALGDDTTVTSWNEENGMLVLEELRPPNSIKILRIWDYNGLNFPRWMGDELLLQQLVELCLGFCKRLTHLPPLWLLKSLEVLTLKRLDNLKYVISDSAGDSTVVQAFTSLKALRLTHLGSSEYWWENNNGHHLQANCFPALVRLEIKKCPELAGLMPLAPSLKELELVESSKIVLGPWHVKGLESLFIEALEEVASTMWQNLEEEEDETTSFVLSCLEVMEIVSCDWMFSSKFSKLWRSMTSLECLCIGGCKSLRSLATGMERLTALRWLAIRHCPEVTTLPQGLLQRLSDLEGLRLYGCPELEEKCRRGGEYWGLVSHIQTRHVGDDRS